jgi:hypothetical protein
MARQAVRAKRLVGREPLMEAVAGPLVELTQGRGALLLLSGEPGIGKTRLAEEIVARARALGATVAWGSSWRGDAAPPLWPWMMVLRELTGSTAVLDQPGPETPTASAAARFKQLDSVLAVIRAHARAHPLVIVIDDLQWADAGSIAMLTFIASALRNSSCLIVATSRSGEMRRDDVAELSRVGTTLAVPPLDDDAAAALLRDAVGARVSPDAEAAIVQRAAGNPLFVWEFGQLMAQSGRTDVAPAAIPPAVAAVIERRLARLAEPEVAVLRAAAVVGSPFQIGTIRDVLEVDQRALEDAMDAATSIGIVARVGQASFAFSHDLVRDVVVASVDARSRADLHRRTAEAFRRRAESEPAFLAVVAEHMVRAGEEHGEAAGAQWRVAAEYAHTLLAYEDAATYFARSAECACNTKTRGERRLDEGREWLLAGDLEAARRAFTTAVSIGRAERDAELLASGLLGLGTGPVGWEVPFASPEQCALIGDTLEWLPADAVRLRSMLLARLSVADATPQTMDVARQRAEEALRLAQSAGDPALIGQALSALNDALAAPAHVGARRENADAIVELAQTAGDRALELLGYRFRIVADLELGDIAAVDHDIEEFDRLATALRQPLLSWFVPLFRGMRAMLAGNLDAAERYRSAVEAAAVTTGSLNAHLMAMTLRTGLDVARGERPESNYLEDSIDVDPGQYATFASGLAIVSLQMGDRRRARDLLDLHADNGFARLGDDGEHLTTLLLFGRVARALDHRDASARLYELLSPFAGLWAVDGIAGMTWGPVDLELGHLAAALGRWGDARRHAELAQASARNANAPLFTADAEDLLHRIDDIEVVDHSELAVFEQGDNIFRAEGALFTLEFHGQSVRVPSSKGLRDLARLLAEPRREFHVFDLAGHPRGSGLAESGDLGELLDARARAEYKRRIAELDDDLADAEGAADLTRAEKARIEREFLVSELRTATGLRGRGRHVGDPVERARKAVTARIRLAIGRLDSTHAALGRHLTNSVRTGVFCTYEPESDTRWQT